LNKGEEKCTRGLSDASLKEVGRVCSRNVNTRSQRLEALEVTRKPGFAPQAPEKSSGDLGLNSRFAQGNFHQLLHYCSYFMK
jgi:hypothetical protein